jgi:hypothetical protein
MSAPHPRTRERFLALYEITGDSGATRYNTFAVLIRST